MKGLKEYICEKFQGYGTRVMNLKEIYQALKSRGIFDLCGKYYPDIVELCQSLSFANDINLKRPEEICIEISGPECIKFAKSKAVGTEYVYFMQMHEEKRGTKDDLMKIVKYLRKKVKDTDDELEKYGNHPNMLNVKEFIEKEAREVLDNYNKKNKSSYKMEVSEDSYRDPSYRHLHGNGYMIELTCQEYARGEYYDKRMGIMSFWEDTLGCLHFEFTRGGFYDGGTIEDVEWKPADIKKKVKWFIETALR